MKPQILLASTSPRRRELLASIGVAFDVCSIDVDESGYPNETPEDYVRRIAAAKSAAGCKLDNSDGLPVLAADTAVVVHNQILGKPKDKSDALRMLQLLSGTTHRVYSAVSLRGKVHGMSLSVTSVTFKELSQREMLAYWESGEPTDKAGAYAIQGRGAVFARSIVGSYSGVVGLPLFETAELLQQQGIKLLNE